MGSGNKEQPAGRAQVFREFRLHRTVNLSLDGHPPVVTAHDVAEVCTCRQRSVQSLMVLFARLRHSSSMVAPAQLMAMTAACVLLVAVPGPSVMFIVGRALSCGRRTALASVAGNCIGVYLAAVCIAVGLGPLLERSDALFNGIKWVGVAYLVWLGLRAVRHARPPAIDVPGTGRAERTWRSMRTGIVVGVTNPKSFIVFASILPQFINRGAGHVVTQMLVLGLVPVLIGMVTDSSWAIAADHVRDRLSTSPGRMTAIGRVGGFSMIGVALALAVTGRHD